jgi:hypothetical protein
VTISYLCGFEVGHLEEAFSITGAPTVQTTTVRSGTYALQCNAVAAATFVRFQSRAAAGTNRSIMRSARFYMRIATLPLALTNICALGTASGGALALGLNPAGTLVLRAGATTRATSVSAFTADNLWHLVEFDAGWSGSNVGMRVFVDGIQWASDATDTAVTTTTTADFGVITATTANIYFDDIVMEDSTLVRSTWQQGYKIVMVKPTADSARSAGWFRTDGTTTTGLFNEVNIVPPAGNTSTVLGTGKHVKDSASSTTDNYDATCATYASAGIGGYDEVSAVQAIVNTGQAVTTGSPKAGAVVITANPPGQTENSFDYGLPNGTAGSTTAAAFGTFPTGWGTNNGPASQFPAVDITIGPTVRIGKRIASTREVDGDFMGVNVMYTASARNPRPVMPMTRVARIRSNVY